MLFGFIADFIIKEQFSPKKFIMAFYYLAIYLSIVASIYVIGEKMGDVNEALFIVKTTTYAFVYFYTSNILRNLKTTFPQNKAIAFLYFVVGFEFTKRIPGLSEFLKREMEKSDDLNSV